MGTMDNQQTWVPYESTKDCSLGFCSIYCPQWCYVIFPPPPPPFSDSSSGGPTFSPLVIAVIGILACATLLVVYYTIVSKYCAGSLRRHLRRDSAAADDNSGEHRGTASSRPDTWYTPAPSDGVEESVIKSITVCKYKKGEGLIEGTDCSVCLNEFREEECLRLLPKCSHAFHVSCIDTWLKSHANCPLCRAGIIPPLTPPLATSPAPPPQLSPAAPPEPPSAPPVPEIRHNGEGDIERGREEGREEEEEEEHGAPVFKDSCEDGISPFRRSISMDEASRKRYHTTIADVLEIEDGETGGGVGSSGRQLEGEDEEEQGKDSRSSRVLHCVRNPVPMKRSISSGRFGFGRQGRGTSGAILPI